MFLSSRRHADYPVSPAVRLIAAIVHTLSPNLLHLYQSELTCIKSNTPGQRLEEETSGWIFLFVSEPIKPVNVEATPPSAL